ncbi:hypothetical protein K5X82_18385 [Halosquirtibacter xylanolyticus]|uniref:hypothetical protein n=1 Tax=Halosquirtibacter xylanolyticus TaxID=3374599 RepID=UPI003748BFA7|nr:hypothetical protein K5X82_18385 [Prolixibacteraceae bacterium]
MALSDKKYNDARTILITAGSKSAANSHLKHTKGKGSPEGHGVQLIVEAIEEFRQTDAKSLMKTRGMSMEHFVAVSNAATEMGMNIEDIFETMGDN